MASRINTIGGDLRNTLQQRGGRIIKAINDAMQDEMRKVQKEAIANAPVDMGNLEAAIKITSQDRRRTWIVYVDESMPDDTGNYTVGDYAMWLHESSYDLGEKSVAKAASNGHHVGRKYMERPFQEAIQGGLVERLAKFAREHGLKDV